MARRSTFIERVVPSSPPPKMAISSSISLILNAWMVNSSPSSTILAVLFPGMKSSSCGSAGNVSVTTPRMEGRKSSSMLRLALEPLERRLPAGAEDEADPDVDEDEAGHPQPGGLRGPPHGLDQQIVDGVEGRAAATVPWSGAFTATTSLVMPSTRRTSHFGIPRMRGS